MLASFSQSAKRSYFLILGMAFIYFAAGSMLLYLPKFFVGLGANKQDAGILVALAFVPFVIFSILSGHIANKLGAGRLVLIGNILHFSAALLFLTVDEISPVVYLLRIMQGLGHVCVFTPMFTAIARIVPDKFKAQGIGYFTIAIQFGTASGSFIGEYLISNFGYTLFFLVVAAMNLFCATSSLFLRGAENEAKTTHVESLKDNKATNWKLVLGGMTLIFVLGGVFGTLLQFIPVYFDELLASGIISEPIPSRYFLTSALISVACIRLLGGRHIDGKYKNIIILACHAGLLIVIYLITLIQSKEISLLVSILFGLSYGLIYPMANAFVLTKVSAKSRGIVTGSLTMLFEGGFRGYALVAGVISHHLGFTVMFYSMILFYAIGVLLYYLAIISEKNGKGPISEDEVETVFEDGMIKED